MKNILKQNETHLSLGCHQNTFIPNLNIISKTQQTGNHHFCPITDGIDSAVFYNNTWVFNQQQFKRFDLPLCFSENKSDKNYIIITTRRKYVSSLDWSYCHCASNTSCMVTKCSYQIIVNMKSANKNAYSTYSFMLDTRANTSQFLITYLLIV